MRSVSATANKFWWEQAIGSDRFLVSWGDPDAVKARCLLRDGADIDIAGDGIAVAADEDLRTDVDETGPEVGGGLHDVGVTGTGNASADLHVTGPPEAGRNMNFGVRIKCSRAAMNMVKNDTCVVLRIASHSLNPPPPPAPARD